MSWCLDLPRSNRWDLRPLAVMLTAAMGVEHARGTSTCSSTQRVSLGKVSEFEEASMKEVKLEGGSAVLLGVHLPKPFKHPARKTWKCMSNATQCKVH